MRKKISIFGAGNVGSHTAMLCAQRELGDDTRVRGRHLGGGLVRLDADDRLLLRDLVALGDEHREERPGRSFRVLSAGYCVGRVRAGRVGDGTYAGRVSKRRVGLRRRCSTRSAPRTTNNRSGVARQPRSSRRKASHSATFLSVLSPRIRNPILKTRNYGNHPQ